jgi:hypothetical protein
VSYVDKETLRPLKFKASRREGFYKKEAETIFDRTENVARFHNAVDNSRKEYPIPQDMFDIVSIFYFLRTVEPQLGQLYSFDIDFAETIFTVFAEVQKKARITIPGRGRIEAFMTEPYVEVAGDPVKDGAASLWFSVEDTIPVRMKLKAPLFTTMTAVLVNYDDIARDIAEASE